MKDKEFIEISTFLKEQESTFLLPGVIEKVATSENLQEALTILRKSSPEFTDVEDILQADVVLRQNTEDAYQMVYEQIPYPEIVDILTVRYEFESLKTALYSHFSFSPQPPVYLRIGPIPTEEYENFFKHQDPFESQLPDYLLKPAQKALQLVENNASPSDAQQNFQQLMYGQMLDRADTVNNVFITDTVKTMIDFHNALALLQTRYQSQDLATLESLLIEGGKTNPSFFLTGFTRPLIATIPAIYHKDFSTIIENDIAYYEKTGERMIFYHLFRYIQRVLVGKADLVEYGAEVPFSFLLKKEYQIAQIRTILYGKEKGTNSEVLLRFLHFKTNK